MLPIWFGFPYTFSGDMIINYYCFRLPDIAKGYIVSDFNFDCNF